MELLYIEKKYPIIALRQQTSIRGCDVMYYNTEYEWIQIIKYYDNKEVFNEVKQATDKNKEIIGKLYHKYVANKLKKEANNGKAKD